MALEETLERLIVALNANTEAHGGKPSATAKPGLVKPGAVAAEGKATMAMVKAALIEVKDTNGRPAALSIIKKAGKAAEMNAIKPAQYQAVLDACAALKDDDDGGTEAADEDNEL